ncbi:DmsC/YnfH family molybdoenzyme membrane anchor subunit [Granulicella tundricola]|uniref:4Fe-4S ferredoxin iron-sulfur binding domain-containing protein n=1 Tax=Granulicella tundricola (strain ATCC BAA-1859 / DSM 23138 / MP5ACTX9) TaxID=1198114 RepID=E8X511_GRATM|nr:DmsC/YnfH family molybdoenzyme membrane anchor subunit [Granulicella tundricola]ADW67203.1 4Fe-4S ferredoxin iron-sulfur binding domain-containing protein [Granulicella tundricola MP5ACTX9]
MNLPLHERAVEGTSPALVRMTGLSLGEHGILFPEVVSALIPARKPGPGEQYRFHFDMTKCIGCRSCEVACNEQNNNPADILWRRIGELEAGSYPDTQRHYLSMGCNHCLDADCLKGCPVDAYTKDPVSGIVLHSADACIGCSYCVWNCPYSVPQYNPERGVVGKCDMCKGRLDDGLEPACVNACPEGAIEIELVNMAEWRSDYALADSPGMPAAEQTVSTTRITLPHIPSAGLERVDLGQIQREHAHVPLIYMTALMQAVSGALWVLIAWHALDAVRLFVLLTITATALTLSTLHLGRPAFAYRALKMWRRSWLSREVLLFTLFFAALAAATVAAAAREYGVVLPIALPLALSLTAAILGVLGTLASAAIYLVKARPAWNTAHTPADFILTAALLGSLLAAALAGTTLRLPIFPTFATATPNALALILLCAGSWLINQTVRAVRLRRAAAFEARAAWALLSGDATWPVAAGCVLLLLFALIATADGSAPIALGLAFASVLLSRYLFFVTVVPLNMALTFVRSRPAGAHA